MLEKHTPLNIELKNVNMKENNINTISQLKLPKGVLILYHHSLIKLSSKSFSINNSYVYILHISKFLQSKENLQKYFSKVSSLDILILTHGYFTTGGFNITDSKEFTCQHYFEMFNKINENILKNVLVTCCQGIFAHLHIGALKQGSRIYTLSLHDTLTHITGLLYMRLDDRDSNIYKNNTFIVEFLYFCYFYKVCCNKILYGNINNTIFFPIVSGILDNTPKMRILFDFIGLEDVTFCYGIIPILKSFDKDYKDRDKHYEAIYLNYIKNVFDIEENIPNETIFNEVSLMLKKSPLVEESGYLPNNFSITYPYIINMFNKDAKTLECLLPYIYYLDYSLPSNKLLSLKVNNLMLKYLKELKNKLILEDFLI